MTTIAVKIRYVICRGCDTEQLHYQAGQCLSCYRKQKRFSVRKPNNNPRLQGECRHCLRVTSIRPESRLCWRCYGDQKIRASYTIGGRKIAGVTADTAGTADATANIDLPLEKVTPAATPAATMDRSELPCISCRTAVKVDGDSLSRARALRCLWSVCKDCKALVAAAGGDGAE